MLNFPAPLTAVYTPIELEKLAIFMHSAQQLAAKAAELGEIPVGALVLDANLDVIAQGWNTRETAHDPTGHAEIMALRQAAARLGTWRLENCTLLVTLEPCIMCAGALVNARISRLIFGAWDEKAGACGSLRDVVRDPRLNHRLEVYGGLYATSCTEQLQRFFSIKRG